GTIVADGTLEEVKGNHSTLEDAYFALTNENTGVVV
ncbi:ABC transporter, partial [Paenibacillus sp. VTT E-133291]